MINWITTFDVKVSKVTAQKRGPFLVLFYQTELPLTAWYSILIVVVFTTVFTTINIL